MHQYWNQIYLDMVFLLHPIVSNFIPKHFKMTTLAFNFYIIYSKDILEQTFQNKILETIFGIKFQNHVLQHIRYTLERAFHTRISETCFLYMILFQNY